MPFVWQSYVLVCHSYVIHMSLVYTRMSFVSHSYALARMSCVCHSHVLARVSSLCNSYVLARMSSVCHSYVLACMSSLYHSYVLAHMSSVCYSYVLARMSSVCHSYVLACHPYVSRMCMLLVCGFTMNHFSKADSHMSICNKQFNLWEKHFRVTGIKVIITKPVF